MGSDAVDDMHRFILKRSFDCCPDTIEKGLMITINIKRLVEFGSVFQNVKINLHCRITITLGIMLAGFCALVFYLATLQHLKVS